MALQLRTAELTMHNLYLTAPAALIAYGVFHLLAYVAGAIGVIT